MHIVIAQDHAGFAAHALVRHVAESLDNTVQNLGCFDTNRVHYPEYAGLAAQEVLRGRADCAILTCGTGIGMSMAANRHTGIRAAVCATTRAAALTRAHNDANVLCIGARISTQKELEQIIHTFLTTGFEGGRHQERLEMF